MTRIIYLVIIIVLTVTQTNAQNIVTNGSFENYVSCPTALAQFNTLTVGWRSYSQASPDLFNSCSVGGASVPTNSFGNQLAAHGNGYVGIVDYYSNNYREYIATSFPAMLVNGMYEVSMSVSLGDNYNASNGLGAYFYHSGPATITGTSVAPVVPQVSFTSYGNITDKVNWVRLTQTFVCTAPYTDMVIGGFIDNATMLASSNPPAGNAYFYIDSVVVKLVTPIIVNFSGTGYCPGATISVPYTVPAGYFNTGNVFTLQLSGPTGSFATPVNIGTLASVTSGSITGTIPVTTVNGTGYRVRIVSTNPANISDNNGTNIQVSSPGLAALSNSPLCAGNTLSLTSSAVSGTIYSWTGPGSFTSNISSPSITNVQPVHAGSYVVTATLNGCVETQTLAVAVNPVPVISLATNNGPLCEGANLALAAQSSTTGSYNWTGPLFYSSSLQNPTINNVALTQQGNYTVTTTVNGCTSAAVSTIVAVNPMPAKPTASNNAPVCSGGILNLFANSSTAGTSYNWSGPNSFTSTQQNPTIDPVPSKAGGKYAVSATLGNCTSDADTTTVVINTVTYLGAYASPNDTVCEGTVVTVVTVPVNGGTSPQFQWFKNNTLIPGATNLTYPATAIATGDSFYCRMIAGNVCSTPITLFSDKIGMTVLPKTPAPTINISSNPANPIPGNAVIFSASMTNGGSNPQLQWQRNGADIAGATANTWAANNLNPYDKINVKLTVAEPCPEANTAYSDTITVNFPAGIHNISGNSSFQIYPNPNDGRFTIRGINTKEAEVQIQNAIGQVVYKELLRVINGSIEVKPNIQLAKGVYFINLQGKGLNKKLPMVIE